MVGWDAAWQESNANKSSAVMEITINIMRLMREGAILANAPVDVEDMQRLASFVAMG